jgi:stage IV sporulation protein B
MKSENSCKEKDLRHVNPVFCMLRAKHSLFLRLLSFLLLLLCLLPAALLPCSAAPLAFFFPTAGRPAAPKTDEQTVMLVPGGQPFGVRLQTEGVMVVSLSEVVSGGKPICPARAGGMHVRDVILAVNGQAVNRAEEVTRAIHQSGGHPLSLTVLRGDERKTVTLTPTKSDKSGEYACGMYIRDSASGIGTVTFTLPDSGLFGGLGHGVCDGDTGALVPLARGQILSVTINGVQRGEAGKPGELRGCFTGRRIGSIVTNCECGVFGLLNEQPVGKYPAMPIATAAELQEGEATILCTLGDDGIGEYKVEISKIDRHAHGVKCFTVRVTDEKLLARTGGIVQGMSGSPILQNGRLVGAVTHVLVDDPTTGYGIFIENMPNAADQKNAGGNLPPAFFFVAVFYHPLSFVFNVRISSSVIPASSKYFVAADSKSTRVNSS